MSPRSPRSQSTKEAAPESLPVAFEALEVVQIPPLDQIAA